ncbi:conserved hypothetical protein [Symbiobacterium thermophilum IAM 14863]|uniref:DUF4870 domain-containing protein n=2 Tax=Symbiobacterium thermophilum TaxID=2734 RepID=Q67KS9_SYMTH|nr:conserved hypothetical protein [Symbiobacterium thermophilum IAM 14863]
MRAAGIGQPSGRRLVRNRLEGMGMSSGTEDRNYGMIAHGLVVLNGASAFMGSLGSLGWAAAVASVVLYFVWKSRSPFVVRHAKQAAGVQVFLFLLSVVLFPFTMLFTVGAAASGSLGGVVALVFLVSLFNLAVGVATIVCGVMGLMRAQKGEEYTYPVVGALVDRIDV